MSEIPDMDAPVTRRELHKALDIWGGALRADITRDVTREVTREVITQVKALIQESERRMIAEMRAMVRGSTEDFETKLTVIDEQYTDLPKRVTKLEAKVFGARPKRTRRPARRR